MSDSVVVYKIRSKKEPNGKIIGSSLRGQDAVFLWKLKGGISKSLEDRLAELFYSLGKDEGLSRQLAFVVIAICNKDLPVDKIREELRQFCNDEGINASLDSYLLL